MNRLTVGGVVRRIVLVALGLFWLIFGPIGAALGAVTFLGFNWTFDKLTTGYTAVVSLAVTWLHADVFPASSIDRNRTIVTPSLVTNTLAPSTGDVYGAPFVDISLW